MRLFPESERETFTVFSKLTSPALIQDFINTIPFNFESGGETYRAPKYVLTHSVAHCMEGAMLAAAALWYHGERPLLLDLKTTDDDVDHVVTLFKRDAHWGAISKTNHAVLRFRDPIFKTVRELALSYFNEYYLDSGKKTLRSYSAPFSLLKYDDSWLTTSESAQHIVNDLDQSKHFPFGPALTMKKLRLAEMIEIDSNKKVEWSHPRTQKQ